MHDSKSLSLIALWFSLALVAPWPVLAQEEGAALAEQPALTQTELDQLLAPVALYPDSLLSQVLMAASFPLDIVVADRWVKANPSLEGEALDAALSAQSWDVSVKSLTFVPAVLGMMSEQLEWTARLGEAFVRQGADVMATVQSLRGKAQAAGQLATTTQQTVIVEKEIIRIEPANPQVIYVPVYNPLVVYGPWWYPGYPPYAFAPCGYVVVGPHVVFTTGFVTGAWLFGGFAWSHGYVWVDHHSHFVEHHHHRHHGHGSHSSAMPMKPPVASTPGASAGRVPWSRPPAMSRPFRAQVAPLLAKPRGSAPSQVAVQRTLKPMQRPESRPVTSLSRPATTLQPPATTLPPRADKPRIVQPPVLKRPVLKPVIKPAPRPAPSVKKANVQPAKKTFKRR